MKIQKVSLRNRLEAKDQIAESFKNTGFAIVTDFREFLDFELVEKAYQEWKSFFALPEESKALFKFDPEVQAGWFPFGSEKAKDSTIKDLKEFYHFYSKKGNHPNFLAATPELFHRMEEIATLLLGLIEDATPDSWLYGMEPFSHMIKNSDQTLLRPIYYPKLEGLQDTTGAIRAAAHEDINLITLLPAATAAGLQVKDIEGRWHEVELEPNSIVVNVGDMLQEATNGYYPSTTHRVVNPDDSNTDRLSMPLFLHPRSTVRLSERYTAGEYLEERLKELGLK